MARPKFTKRRVNYTGPIRSVDWNSTVDELEFDMHWLFDKISSLDQEIADAKLMAVLSNLTNRTRTERSFLNENERRAMQARAGDTLWDFLDFRTAKNLLWEDPDSSWSVTEANRLRVDIGYGQATLPYDKVVSRFWTVSPDRLAIIPVGDIETEVQSVKEAGALKVITGNVQNAFNGHNEYVWKREVWYPLHSDVDEVIVDLDVTVPVALQSKSNVLQIHPFPNGLVDVISVSYETADVTPTLDISDTATTAWVGPTFPVNEAGWLRGHFKPLGIQRIKVRLRQRNWVERDGFKVFVYGLQELGLLMVDFSSDDTNLNATNPTNDKAVVARFDAPDGYDFNEILGIYSDPAVGTDFVLALYSDSALTNQVWNSDQTLPQAGTAIVLPADTTSVYVALGLGYDQTNDVAPLLENLSLRYTVVLS